MTSKASFFTSLHLLNLKQSDFSHTIDVNCIKVNEKYNCCHSEYSSSKNEYFLSRCSKCEHQWRMRKNMKYVDDLFKKYKCIFLSWDLNYPLILFFSNGSIVSMKFNDENNTLLGVQIDNGLCGKFLPSRIVDVVVCKKCIYITYTEPKLSVIYINNDSPSLFSKIFSRNKGKLVGYKPKIEHIDLSVHGNKSLERKLSLSNQRDFLLVWWKNSSDVWPWTPITYLTDRVNMLVYSVKDSFIELLCPVKVQNELLHVTFSKVHSNQFFSLEEIQREGEIIVTISVFEVFQGLCRLIFNASLPVRGNLIAFDWSRTEDKLLAADSDGQILIYDIIKKWTIVTNVEFLPKYVSWHPQDCIALIVSESNQLACFDMALNMIGFKLCYKSSTDPKVLELSSYFHCKFCIQKVLWQKSAFNDTCVLLLNSELSSFILVKFSFGFITRHNVSALEIVSQYLKTNSIDQAILLLRSLDWCSKGEVKFQCMSKIVNCFLRKPLDFYTQGGLELALGSYYNWVDILPSRIIKIYEPRMHHLARRFFHHLLRYHKFRKAFLLAIDLEAQDLFLDLYHVALQKGENILAAVALHKAKEFEDSDESTSGSYSSESNSESSHDDISYSNFVQPHETDNVSWSQSPYIGNFERLHHGATSEDVQTVDSESNKQFFSSRSRHEYLNSRNIFSNKSPVSSNYFITSQYATESVPGPSAFHGMPEHSVETFPYSHYTSDQGIFRNPSSKNICDNQDSSAIKNIGERSVVEEENEEMEGTQIKLAHLGII